MRDLIIALLAALGVLAQIAVVLMAVGAVIWLVAPTSRDRLREARDTIRAGALWMAWGAATVATLGSLWFSESAGFVPCRLCWFQRIAMYPLVVVLLVAAITRDRRGFWYGMPLAVIGALVSIYHIYIEVNPSAESAGCKASGVSCSARWIDEFGYVTIPVLALSAFALIGALLLVHRSRSGDDRQVPA